MTLSRSLFALCACLALSACYLKSEPPRFSDAEAVFLVGSEPATFAHFDLEGATWDPADAAIVTLIPEDGHYRLHDDTGPETTEADPDLRFIPLDADHWLMQLSAEVEGETGWAYFAVATWDGKELLLRAIACDDLRGKPGIADLVTFAEDNCDLLPLAAGAAPDFPELLWRELPPADKKLVLQP